MKLTQQQLQQIRNAVESGGITISTLRDDLIDHVCCVVEEKLQHGQPFESALREALMVLAPNGIREIETETLLLLNIKQVIMKKALYLLGLATTISMTMGLMMKILHMPGGEVLFNSGFLVFAFLFVPVVLIRKFAGRVRLPLYEKLKSIFGALSAVGIALAVLLKLAAELEVSGLILMISVGVFSFGFLPFFFYDLYRDSFKRDQDNNLEDVFLQ